MNNTTFANKLGTGYFQQPQKEIEQLFSLVIEKNDKHSKGELKV